MALDPNDLRELKEQDELLGAQITDDTRIAVQKGDEALKWISVGQLRTYLTDYFQEL